MSDNTNLESNLSKVEKHLADAGKQAVSKAEATIVEEVYWLNQTTSALKQSYDEKIVQLEAELQSAHEKIASLTSSSKTSKVSDPVKEVKIEELPGHVEPTLVVEKAEKITTPSAVVSAPAVKEVVEKKVQPTIVVKPAISTKKK